MSSGALLSLPNVVSLSRLALAAAFLVVQSSAVRLAIIATAAFTDYLDGWLARRRSEVTRYGALIDPIADRVFVLAAVCAYLFEGRLTDGQYFVLISRDLATAIGFLVARGVSWLRPIPFRARPLGKVVTTLQLVTLLAFELAPERVPLLVWLVGIASVAAIADYTLALWRQRAT
jgi:CDP-diacylglycerol--glycerol-3-phosphate 3-phosphatidyltransferase